MKANELRIGNIVMYTGNKSYGEFGAITIKTIEYTGCNGWQDMGASGIMDYDELFGIPLTEDWLLKFGFEKKHGNECFYFTLKDFDINLENKSLGWYNTFDSLDFSTLDKCQYIHQLQNLYFALTGTELTYTP